MILSTPETASVLADVMRQEEPSGADAMPKLPAARHQFEVEYGSGLAYQGLDTAFIAHGRRAASA